MWSPAWGHGLHPQHGQQREGPRTPPKEVAADTNWVLAGPFPADEKKTKQEESTEKTSVFPANVSRTFRTFIEYPKISKLTTRLILNA